MMDKKINDVELEFPEDRAEMVRLALETDDAGGVSVGGLARDLDMLSSMRMPPASSSIGSHAVARLIQLWRRRARLDVVKLADQAGLTPEEVFAAEQGDRTPEPRVLHALSEVLDVSYDKLLHLAGHTKDRDEAMETAAVRFAASSDSVADLSPQDEEALHRFISLLAK